MNYKIEQSIALFLIVLVILLPVSFAQEVDPAVQAVFVDVNLPEYYNKGSIDISGKTLPSANVDLYVNDTRADILAADADGNFSFSGIALKEGSNVIRFNVNAQDIAESYTITVDTIDPELDVGYIPDFVSSKKITVNGSINEEVNISIYVIHGGKDDAAPPKVTGLRSDVVEANKVELSWEAVDVDDFAKYILYRNNKAVFSADTTDYTDYSDTDVNSNQEYSYQVAAMDKGGRLGERSGAFTVTTPEGGAADKEEPVEIDILEGISGLKKVVSNTVKFREEGGQGEGDGTYTIKIEAVDRAGNKVLNEVELKLDTKPLKIKIISPPNGADIYENYADQVKIKGETSAGAKVYLYVRRTPLGFFNTMADISGLPDEIQDLPETKLIANCNANVEGEEKCKTHADYFAIAGGDGSFEFENVDLTSMFAGAFRVTEYPTGAIRPDLTEERYIKDYMESHLYFLAVDAAGSREDEGVKYEIKTCWSGNLTWGIRPMPEYQTPSLLSVERLREGTEIIYFTLELGYNGVGEDGRVTNMYVADACGDRYLEEQEGYDYSCKILRSCNAELSKDGKIASVACKLGRIYGIEKWTDDDWGNFIDAVRDEMRFPFRIRLTYNEYFENNRVEGGKQQMLCSEIGYVVDATMIDARNVLPDWLLYDFADFLDKRLDTLDDWTEKTKQILRWTVIGCIGSYLLKFAVQSYRRIACHLDEILIVAGVAQLPVECTVECINSDLIEKLKGGSVQDSLSDTCLNKCYPSCSAAWGSEASLYNWFRWTCDRVFGHKAPSRWTETVSTTDLYQKATSGSGCANDQSVRGKPLRAISCKSVEKEYRDKTFDRDDVCFEIVNIKDRTKELYLLGDPVNKAGNEYLYGVTKLVERGAEVTYNYVIKQNEDYYFTYQDQTCAEICNEEGKVLITTITKQGGTFVFETPGSKDKKQVSASALCTTTNQCLSFKKGDRYVGRDGKPVEISKDAEPFGYTQDCFYEATQSSNVYYTGNLGNVNVVSGNPDERMECCCINSEKAVSPVKYYLPSDVETKSDPESKGQGADNNPEALKDMKWSYRYSKINYWAESGATGYDPNRYIEGRDYSACLGQNNYLYDGLAPEEGKTGNLLIIDPMKQHEAAFQCVAITQVLNRLRLLRNIMNLMKSCLVEVRTTGRGDAGVCKEIFTQYLCSFIWKMITWFQDGCLPFGSGIDFTKSDNKVMGTVSAGMKGVWESVADSQNEMASEYSNVEVTNLLGMGEQDVFRKVCLGAFGYDWEISIDSVVDIAYNTPFATLVKAIAASREFLGVDITSGKARYEYRSSWLINPGCDFDSYTVKLACVTRDDMRDHGDIDCGVQGDPWGENCDCLELPRAQELLFYQESRDIKQNQLVEVDSSQIGNKVKVSPYRYDHLKFELNVERNFREYGGNEADCFPPGNPDGIFYEPIGGVLSGDVTARDIAGCSADKMSGVFSCKQGANLFYEQGIAEIHSVSLRDDGIFYDDVVSRENPYGGTFYVGEPISGKVKYSKDEKKQCLIVRIYDESGNQFRSGERARSQSIDLKGAAEKEVKSFVTDYIIKLEDLMISQGIVDYERELEFTGNPGIVMVPEENRAYLSKESYSIRFIDADGDEVAESYEILGGENGEVGTLLHLGGFGVRFKRPYVGPDGEHKYVIYTVPEKSSGDETGKTIWKLHIDIRSPKADGSCDEVKGFEYDSSQIMVVEGAPQYRDIPIIIEPYSRKSEEVCEGKYATEKITEEDYCICGGRKKNCADKEKGYSYCFNDKCRKYSKCVEGEENREPCVCKTSTSQSKYDCAHKEGLDVDFIGWNKTARYCINKKCVKEEEIGQVKSMPVIKKEESMIQTDVKGGPESFVKFGSRAVIGVQSKFKVLIRVDDKGTEIDKVIVAFPSRGSFEIDEKDKYTDYWSKEIDLSTAEVGDMYTLNIYARVDGKSSERLKQDIMIIGKAEEES